MKKRQKNTIYGLYKAYFVKKNSKFGLNTAFFIFSIFSPFLLQNIFEKICILSQGDYDILPRRKQLIFPFFFPSLYDSNKKTRNRNRGSVKGFL